jgi:hypothetical protein
MWQTKAVFLVIAVRNWNLIFPYHSASTLTQFLTFLWVLEHSLS